MFIPLPQLQASTFWYLLDACIAACETCLVSGTLLKRSDARLVRLPEAVEGCASPLEVSQILLSEDCCDVWSGRSSLNFL